LAILGATVISTTIRNNDKKTTRITAFGIRKPNELEHPNLLIGTFLLKYVLRCNEYNGSIKFKTVLKERPELCFEPF